MHAYVFLCDEAHQKALRGFVHWLDGGLDGGMLRSGKVNAAEVRYCISAVTIFTYFSYSHFFPFLGAP